MGERLSENEEVREVRGSELKSWVTSNDESFKFIYNLKEKSGGQLALRWAFCQLHAPTVGIYVVPDNVLTAYG